MVNELRVQFPVLLRWSFIRSARPQKDSLTVCPKGVETRNVSATQLEIGVSEGMDAMVRPAACALYRNHQRSLMSFAERIVPTKSIAVQRGDTW